MNKIVKGKKGLIWLGIVAIILGVICGVFAVFCTTWGAIDNRWWLYIIAAFLYVFSLGGLILGITFVWTGSALKATQGSLKEDNLGIGTANMTKCPKCGNEVQATDTNCGNCGKSLTKTKICPKCNQEVPADNNCCNKCGTELK